MRFALAAFFLLPSIAFGQAIPGRELAFRLDRERREGIRDGALERLVGQRPRAVFYRNGRPLRPVVGPIRKTIRTELAIFGGELEAVTTAMAAADRGASVVLVADCPLGGLSADTGGNLRYIDGIASVPRTPAQLALYRAIGVKGQVAIPGGVDRQIDSFLAAKYAHRIEVVRTDSLSMLSVRGAIEEVVTEEGVAIRAARYLDMDPECRLGEQAGLSESVETPNLAYGLVFDLLHLRPEDYKALRRHDKLKPQVLLHWLGLAGCPPKASSSLARLERDLRSDVTRVYTNSSLGYKALADGFDFVMNCKPGVPGWLNERRLCTGFNISHLGTSANVNSLSYRLDDVVLQHCHSLTRDPRFRPIVNEEIGGLADYLRYVTGNPRLRVRFPDQFYVRRQTAFFPTLHPYTQADFRGATKTKWWMSYSLDFRGLTPRDRYDLPLMHRIRSNGYGVRRWDCRASSCETSIPNLFVLNKCSMTPEYSGGLRIVQNLINTGQAWVEATIGSSKPKRRSGA